MTQSEAFLSRLCTDPRLTAHPLSRCIPLPSSRDDACYIAVAYADRINTTGLGGLLGSALFVRNDTAVITLPALERVRASAIALRVAVQHACHHDELRPSSLLPKGDLRFCPRVRPLTLCVQGVAKSFHYSDITWYQDVRLDPLDAGTQANPRRWLCVIGVCFPVCAQHRRLPVGVHCHRQSEMDCL